jgi:hypothetical protein
MDELIKALAPVFAAGLSIQQLGEILSPVIDKISPNNKKIIVGLFSLVIGLLLAFCADLHVLHLLGLPEHKVIDPLVTGFIISGGTEGVNSILKFLKYKKEETKTEAAAKVSSGVRTPVTETVAAPTAEALAAMNRK